MADSPAKRHLRRCLAAQEAAARSAEQPMDGASQYELTLMRLHQDQLRLKQLQSVKAKGEMKAELLPAYDEYVEGVLTAGQGAADEALVTLMLWNIDAARYPEALRIAEYVLAHNMPMPDRFQRTTGCVIADEIGEAALMSLKADTPFDLAVLEQAQRLTADQDMPDEARAKLHLAQARHLLASDDPDNLAAADVNRAVDLLREALHRHKNCGAKKDLERAERVQKKQAAVAATGERTG